MNRYLILLLEGLRELSSERSNLGDWKFFFFADFEGEIEEIKKREEFNNLIFLKRKNKMIVVKEFWP